MSRNAPSLVGSLSRLLLGMAVAACGGGEGGSGPTVSPVATVTLSQETLSLRVGGSAAIIATARDQSGAAISGRAVSWTSANPAVATVSGAGTGIVTAVAPGQTNVTATIDGRTASALVVVAPAVGRVAVTAPATTIDQGQSLTLSATVFDTQNAPIPNAPVTWASSNENIATISPAGVVTARTPGTVTMFATSENVQGSVALIVRPIAGGTLAVTAISPGTLAPGSTITITGTGFSGVAGENTVTIGGVVVPVTTASATQITAQLAGDLPCQSLGNVDVTVVSPFGTTTRAHPLETATRRTLGVGEALVVSEESGLRCNELSGGSRFIVAVVNTAGVSSSVVNFDVRGAPSGATALVDNVATTTAAKAVASQPVLRLRSDAAARASRDAAHERLLATDRALVRRLGPPSRRRGTTMGMAAADPVPTIVGAKDTLRVRPMDNCRTYTNVPATVVYVGTKSIILEADDSPLAGTMNEDYAELGREYDATMHDILATNFGNPLAFDAQTDGNGRIVMLFTRVINNRGEGLLAFVSACDFYPPSLDPQVAASNQAEVFYARVPTTNGTTFQNNDERVIWKWRIRATLIHEAKHIVSYATKFQSDADAFEESWAEEGSAQIAEELFGRTFWGTSWKENASYRETMYCDLRPNPASFPECGATRPPRAIGDHVAFLFEYSEDHEGQTFLSSGGEASHIYGSAWAFLRFVIDNYATSEAGFLRDFVAERSVSGVQNVERRAGRGFAELATNFALAMASDDVAGFTAPAGSRYGFPSWNLADIWAGANRDIPNYYTSDRPYLVRPATIGSAFTNTTSLRGGSAVVYELSGAPAARQLLEIKRATAGTPLRIAILRTQ